MVTLCTLSVNLLHKNVEYFFISMVKYSRERIILWKEGDEMNEIYKNIKRLRKERGWSQEELAKKVGYAGKSMISRVENGQMNLQQSQIIAFAKALNVEPGDLFGSEGVYSNSEERILIDKYRSADEMTRQMVRRLLAYSDKLNEK
jgi:transcriptional regulator with XRE-family HTH domain